MYIPKNPSAAISQIVEDFWAEKKSMQTICHRLKARDEDQSIQCVRIPSVYFPCRCLCFWFFELEEISIRIIIACALWRNRAIRSNSPDDIDAILPADRLMSIVSTQRRPIPQLSFQSNCHVHSVIPCNHRTAA